MCYEDRKTADLLGTNLRIGSQVKHDGPPIVNTSFIEKKKQKTPPITNIK